MPEYKRVTVRFRKNKYKELKKRVKPYKKYYHPGSKKDHVSSYIKKVLDGKIDLEGKAKCEIKKLENLAFELRKIGINMNQIARVANETGHIDSEDLQREKRKVAKLVFKIWKVLR